MLGAELGTDGEIGGMRAGLGVVVSGVSCGIGGGVIGGTGFVTGA